MNDKKRLRWASAILGGLLLLSSCAKTDVPPGTEESQTLSDTGVGTETESQAPAEQKIPNLGPVEPILKNFFAFSGVGKYRELSSAVRLEGDCVSRTEDGAVMVFREARTDTANRATETFTVYSQKEGKAVLKVTNSYRYGSYTPFDWENLSVKDPAVSYPEQVMRVRADRYVGETGEPLVYWIEVARAKVTPVASDSPTADRYDIRTTYEYYDLSGQRITSSPRPVTVSLNGGESGLSFRFGSVNALFDDETRSLLSVSGGDTEVIRYGYTHTTEQYGYYLNGRQPSALGREERFLEVYRREDGERILRYYPEACDRLGSFVLGNGDILLQLRNEVSGESGIAYDYRDGDRYYTLRSYLLDVRTGEATAIECPYYIEAMLSREELDRQYSLAGQGIALTENAVNLCLAASVENGVLGQTRLSVLDHDASLMFAMDRITPEHRITEADPFGFCPLSDGSYLVSLDSPVANRAIVASDGRVRSYLGEDSIRVVGSLVVTADGVYDYDMKSLFSFETGGYTLFATVGERILVRGAYSEEETGDEGMAIFEIVKADGVYVASPLFEKRDMELLVEERDYLILRDVESGKSMMVNVKLAHLLTAEGEMQVYAFEDRYLVSTQLTDENGAPIELFYTVG